MKVGSLAARALVAAVVIAGSVVAPVSSAAHVQAATCATPVITGISPNYGPVTGGSGKPVTISGCGFTGATAISWGQGVGTPPFTVVDDSTITTTAPSFPYWAYGIHPDYSRWFVEDVTVTTPAGTSPIQDSDEFYWFWPGTACSTASLTAALPASPGGPIVLSATTFSCPNPNFRFWIRPPGGSWHIVQDYSLTATYNWTLPANASGTYGLEVDVRDQDHTSVTYDKVANMTYTVGGCIQAGISATPLSPANAGTSVTLTGTSSCPGTPTYRFWVRPPGGVWKIARDYDAANTFTWDTTGLRLGTYALEVDVRRLGSTETYEKVSNITYRVGTPCATPTVIAQPSPSPTGTTVTISATTSGCANPAYRFWVQRKGGRWTMVRDYGVSSTFDWTTPGTGIAGSYTIEADVRDATDTVAYDAVSWYTIDLLGCAAVNLAASAPAPPPFPENGLRITLTGTATCPGPATYRFWVRSPGGSWKIVQDYSTVSTYVWIPGPSGTYGLEVDVRNQGATATYEAVANMSYMW